MYFVWNMIIIKKKSVSWTKNLSCPSIKKYFCGLKNLSLLLSNKWVTFICSIFCLSNQSILLSLWNNIYVAFNWSIFLSQQSEYFSVSVKQYLCGLQEPALESLITAVVPLGPGNLTWPPPYRQFILGKLKIVFLYHCHCLAKSDSDGANNHIFLNPELSNDSHHQLH